MDEKQLTLLIEKVLKDKLNKDTKLIQKMIDDSLTAFKKRHLSFRSKISVDTPLGAYEVSNKTSVSTGTTFLPVTGGTMIDGANISFGTSSGTKLGTSTSQKIGFYNSTPVSIPTVSGSRGANLALQSLLVALGSLGLIIDSSS